MKKPADGAALLGFWLAVLAQSPRIASALPAEPSADLNPVVQDLCVPCHNDVTLSGNLSLETFDVSRAHERAETAEKMIVKLRAGMMPPPEVPRPPSDTLLTLVTTLELVVDRAAGEDPNPGARRFQRLNRAEYERVVEDLLALDVDANRWLPPDTYLGNFDNMSAAQGLSATLLEAYMRAASEVSRLAVGNPRALSATVKYTNPIAVSQHAWDHLEGAPFGTRGGIVVNHDFPADGEYIFSIGTLFGDGTGFEDLDLSIDGEGVALLGLEHGGAKSVPIRTEPLFVRAGQRRVAAVFLRKIEGPYEDRLSPHAWSFVGGEDSQDWANYGITALPHLSDLMITGPLDPVGVQNPSAARTAGESRPAFAELRRVRHSPEGGGGSEKPWGWGPTTLRDVSETKSRQKIFRCRPKSPSEERPCAEAIVSRLARQAYRRPLTAEDLAGPMSFYDRGAASEGFEVGVRTALQAILASPHFLFRLEEAPESVHTGASYRLSDLDLASRLSFFLWGTAPDEALLELASENRLSDPEMLARQVDRMIEDPRSEALAARFASQWLRLQDAEDNQPEPYLYPDFTGQLRSDLVRETELLFDHLVREDRSFLELLTADYTFLNERLAGHYGIPGVSGDAFRRVSYGDDTRRGVLGHGSVLLLTSMSARTSPVLRGKWVMEVLMGTPPPPPPPNIPAFDDTRSTSGGRRLTTRERLEMHRANPTCHSCHRFMDGIGLALDGYDVTGRVRSRENGVPLDTRGTFYDGTEVSTPRELADVLLKRPVPLVRNFTANLLAYAIGRRVESFDGPAIRAIAREAEANGYRISSFLQGVVKSDPFRRARVQSDVQTEQEN